MADLSIDSNLSGGVDTKVSGSFGAIGPVTLGGIPDDYTIRIKDLPKIEIGVDPLEGRLTLDPITLKVEPLETSIRIKEIPNVRTHLPVNYSLGLSLFGIEVAALALCGEGQIITEPYEPNPCEVCDGRELTAAQLAALGERG